MDLPLADPPSHETASSLRPVELIIRADDAGSSRSANQAIREAWTGGILRNISVMAPGPEFDHAAECLRPLNTVCFGMHATLTSEWDHPRWGPVANPKHVPSLIDESGCFPATVELLQTLNPQAEQIADELRAQHQRLLDAGIVPCYLDEHMGIGRLPQVCEQLQRFADESDLIYRPDLEQSPLNPAVTSPDRLIDIYTEALRRSEAELLLMVLHPAFDNAEMRTIQSNRIAGPAVAARRDAERRLLISPPFQRACADRRCVLTRYDQLSHASIRH